MKSPPILIAINSGPQQIHMAELEQASLRSEQLSDKSSSPALPDDLSLDEQSVYQMTAKEGKVNFLSKRLFCHNASPP